MLRLNWDQIRPQRNLGSEFVEGNKFHLHLSAHYLVLSYSHRLDDANFSFCCFDCDCRLNLLEFFVGLYLLFCGWYDVVYGRTRFFIFLFLQSIAFFTAAFGYIGTFVPAPAAAS